MAKEEEVTVAEEKYLKLGIVLNFATKNYPYFSIDALQGDTDDEGLNFVGKVEKIDLGKFVNTEIFSEADKQLVQQLRKLQDTEINKYLNRNSPFSGIWENIIHTDGDDLPDETKALIAEYIQPKLKKIFEENAENPLVFTLPPGKPFKTANLEPASLSSQPLLPIFKVMAKDDAMELLCMVKLNGRLTPVTENECKSSILFQQDNVFYLWQKQEDIEQVERFLKQGNVLIQKHNWSEQLRKVIMPLTRDYQVEFDKSMMREIKNVQPEIKLMLQEKGDYLLLQPIFSYNGYDAMLSDKDTITLPDGDKMLVIQRNKEAEENFLHKVRTLHSQFIEQKDSGSLAPKGAEVLKNNWFFLFIDAMKEMKVPVYGFEALRNFRFNTARPSTHIHVSSGLDWFDANVEIDFNGQRVGIG